MLSRQDILDGQEQAIETFERFYPYDEIKPASRRWIEASLV